MTGRLLPWWRPENLATNQLLVHVVRELATVRGATPSQVALAWLLARGNDVVPIPGTKRRRYLEANLAALDIELSEDELARLNATAVRSPCLTPAEVHLTTVPAR